MASQKPSRASERWTKEYAFGSKLNISVPSTKEWWWASRANIGTFDELLRRTVHGGGRDENNETHIARTG
jgi:hypothetical protein